MAAGLSGLASGRLSHPVYDAVRQFADEVSALPADGLAVRLNALAASGGIRTASGRQVRFEPPRPGRTTAYEQQIFDSGVVPTRADSVHDLFNALAWLAFPRTKAAINRLHVEALHRPSEEHGRGRLRDLLTIFDESGSIVHCSPAIADDIRAHRWRALFWERRDTLAAEFRVCVMGHSVLEKALDPWPGITCKVILVSGEEPDPDLAASNWLLSLSPQSAPGLLHPLPVFGLPGWLPITDDPAIYDDKRWFR